MADFDLLANGVDCATTVSIPALVFTAIEVEEPEEGVGGGGEPKRERRGKVSLESWLEIQGVKPTEPEQKPGSPRKRKIAAAVSGDIQPAWDSVLVPLAETDRVVYSFDTLEFRRWSKAYQAKLEEQRKLEQEQQDEEIAVFLMMMAAAA